MTHSVTTWEQPEVAIEWARLGHAYVVANDKGGVGKTTTSAHLGGLAASDGVRTLLVDLNGQGNCAQLLGFAHTENDDKGRNLFSAVTAGAPLSPARGVRPNLDVIPGGPYVRRIGSVLSAELATSADANRVHLALAECLQTIASDYQLIIIDTPPENPLLSNIALCAGRFVIVPLKTDAFSRQGLRDIASDIRGMREHNPHLTLLAVFVFASGTGSKKIRRDIAKNVSEDLGQSSGLLLDAFIRHAESVANEMVKYGLLAYELEQEIQNNPKYWELRKGSAKNATTVSETSRLVAEDYDRLAKEIFTRAGERRAEMIEEGSWP
ncbi:ParA family protein [Mycobacterium lehmannii]|uniref:ParA family protein n=1 Tax=Mycobacterium lehmannii TaxID=2048550 RepID=UPI000B93B5D5|nr:ParA family protein [Mycobacterium lehmannii]